MSNLASTIRQMLTRKETVILPGFGSLLITESSGTAGETGRIDPPGIAITFDATHPKGDGKLAQEYAAAGEMEYEEARQQVLELVDAIKFSLDKGEEHHLETVGIFTRDDNNKVHFLKDPGWVLDPSLFGLSTLELIELEDEDEVSKSGQESDQVPEGERTASSGSMAETDASGQGSPEKESVTSSTGKTAGPPRARRRPVNKWRIIWVVIGSLAAVLVVILLLPTDNGIEIGKDGIVISDTDSSEEEQNTTTDAEIDGEIPEDGTIEDENVSLDTPGEIEEVLQDPTITEESPSPEHRYFIIGGSFQKLPNATELMNQLQAAGFPSEIIITENRMYRVSVKSYPTRDEALNAMGSVKEASGLESVWVMTR